MAVVGLTLSSTPAHAQPVGTAFTYQGYLEEGGTPASGSFDLRFILYDSESGGSQVASTLERSAVSVVDGVFAADLDFGAVFGGSLRYLEVAVRNSGIESYQTLSPREPLRPAPAAIVAQQALSLPNVTVDGSGNVGIGTTSPASPLTVAGGIESTSGGITFPDGTTQTTAGVGSGSAWQLGGNSGTDPSNGDFIGTSDEAPLELRANGERGLQLESVENSSTQSSVNVIAGSPLNSVSPGVVGATISGGGYLQSSTSDQQPNQVERNFGTVGGGSGNTASGFRATVSGGETNTASGVSATVSGGFGNTASSTSSTVSGGSRNTASGVITTVSGGSGNTASGSYATVSGGVGNTASGFRATVSGGSGNTASGFRATVSGGSVNTASGEFATVSGGQRSEARGDNSFAAGYYARVPSSHNGSFVWSDDSQSFSDSLVSTGPHQFLVRATGGVGVGTNTPRTQLHVTDEISGNGQFVSNYVALLENSSTGGSPDVLALKVNSSQIPNSAMSYVSFFDNSDDLIGRIYGNGSGGVTYSTTGADFAEMLPRAIASERIETGDLVGVRAGAISRSTQGAEHVMIVTDRPAVLGNADLVDNAHPVAFVGQVPVRITGPANTGDLVLASGNHDGTARAIAPDTWNPETHGPIAGRIWMLDGPRRAGVQQAIVAVGVGTTTVLSERLQRQQDQMDDQQDRIDIQAERIETQSERIDALEARLHQIMQRLPAPAETP